MEIKFKNTYRIEVEKEFISSCEVDLKKYAEENDWIINNKSDLVDLIYEYINWGDDSAILFEGNDEAVEDSCVIDILNLDEIIEKYKYLIKEVTCCDNEWGNYCSKCGKKLK